MDSECYFQSTKESRCRVVLRNYKRCRLKCKLINFHNTRGKTFYPEKYDKSIFFIFIPLLVAAATISEYLNLNVLNLFWVMDPFQV